MSSGPVSIAPIHVDPPASGWDRAGARAIVVEAKLSAALHKLVRGSFGHTVNSLRTLEAWVEAIDLARQAGEQLHAALLEDIAKAGSLALPEPTRDQRLFVGAFACTVLSDLLGERLAALGPGPEPGPPLESDGMEELLERPVPEILTRVAGMAGRYLKVQGDRGGGGGGGPGSPDLEVRDLWTLRTMQAFIQQFSSLLGKLTHLGRLRPFGLALGRREVRVGEMRYQGFIARPIAEAATDLKPIRVDQVVGNQEYVEAAQRLARDVAAYDLDQGKSPKSINPVLFALGRPGCGKTITAHAIGNYFLEYCAERDIPARFRVIRRTDWASSYQNASASELIRIFREEVYGFEGVCGVYWGDIDTAFASRSSGDLRMEEKNNLGAVFGIFDGTLIPKDGKWFMICDANYMQMDEATVSRIAQNPFRVRGPTSAEDYAHLLRDIMLADVREQIAPEDSRWTEVGQRCVDHDLSGRNVESIANNIRAHIQDFEYPREYFSAEFDRRAQLVAELSRKVGIDEMLQRVEDYARFRKEAEEEAETARFESEVESLVHQLNAGREARERALAEALAEES